MIELLNYYKDGNVIDVYYCKTYRRTIRQLFLKTDRYLTHSSICINQRYIELLMENFKTGLGWYKLKYIISYV